VKLSQKHISINNGRGDESKKLSATKKCLQFLLKMNEKNPVFVMHIAHFFSAKIPTYRFGLVSPEQKKMFRFRNIQGVI
jgi:hypothetical protein